MMSSCTTRLMMPTDQLFTTTDLVVSYVKKSVTKPQIREPIAARRRVPESRYLECGRKVQLLSSLRGRPWKAHFHHSLCGHWWSVSLNIWWSALIAWLLWLHACAHWFRPTTHTPPTPPFKNVPPLFLAFFTTKILIASKFNFPSLLHLPSGCNWRTVTDVLSHALCFKTLTFFFSFAVTFKRIMHPWSLAGRFHGFRHPVLGGALRTFAVAAEARGRHGATFGGRLNRFSSTSEREKNQKRCSEAFMRALSPNARK